MAQQTGMVNPMVPQAVIQRFPAACQNVLIGDREYPIVGDAGYMNAMGTVFEPSTVHTLRALCDDGAKALDVGANIGLTSLALSQYCEKVVGVEPVPRTFDYLRRNTEAQPNIKVFKHALGNAEGIVRMQGYNDFLAGSFIADTYEVKNDNHFLEAVPIKRLDDCFAAMDLGGLDVMKVDVEGFELEVFEGGRQVIGDLKPMAFLEMNHWCLNVFRRISIPEFRERLLAVFPYVFAMDGENYLDYGDEKNVHNINHGHIIEHRFSNLVAGFDRDQIVERLETLRKPVAPAPVDAGEVERERLRAEVDALRQQLDAASAAGEAYRNSTSWKITAPIRAMVRRLQKITA